MGESIGNKHNSKNSMDEKNYTVGAIICWGWTLQHYTVTITSLPKMIICHNLKRKLDFQKIKG